MRHAALAVAIATVTGGDISGQTLADQRLARLKADVTRDVDARHTHTQQMIDMVFSFGELGYQEFEASRYLTGILRENGFAVADAVAGLPTGWVARWGSGQPVIAVGSDIDAVAGTSQKPGVAFEEPLVPDAPGHGEGHNSGVPLSVTAALAVKAIMERERLPGTLMVWPGVAEELLGGKAFLIRAGVFKDVDVVLFSHVGSNLGTRWGPTNSSGAISIEYTFTGNGAHAAIAPWQGRSALDAVELMNIGWNFRREHLLQSQRVHYVITHGGSMPNIVPDSAAAWYYLRDPDYERLKQLRALSDRMARAATLMTDTTVTSRIRGGAWPAHFNRPVAEAMDRNVQQVGMPQWDPADLALARGLQRELCVTEVGLATQATPLGAPVPPPQNTGGPSDDIGDVSWVVPTAILGYPSNIPNATVHSWSAAVAMATPIAHKGATAGAKVLATTMLDLLMQPELVRQAKEYFAEQTRSTQYEPFVGPADMPIVTENQPEMERVRPAMRRLYYNPARYGTYLEQLGITYPTVRAATTPQRCN